MKNSFWILFITQFFTASLIAQNYKEEAIAAKEPGYACLIKLSKDSSILKYSVLKYKMPPMSYGYLEADGEKLKYNLEDIIAFQDEKGYWLKVYEPAANSKPVVGRLSFDGFFAVRIVSGKIELYTQKSDGSQGFGGRAYFVKKGNVIAGVDIWGVNVKNMMSDNKKMYNSIDVDGRKKIKELIEIIEEYNKSK
ncbi:MAG: hypothetical protein IPP81_10910 [Chitinophagaceae bacterium]|nr:hypothetical protein [Chitinophagaceae bacterium]